VSQTYLPLTRIAAEIETFHKDKAKHTDRILGEEDPRTQRAFIQLARGGYLPTIIRTKIADARAITGAAVQRAPGEAAFLTTLDGELRQVADRCSAYDAAAAEVFKLVSGDAQPDPEALDDAVRALREQDHAVQEVVSRLNDALQSRIDGRVRAAEEDERRSAFLVVALTGFAVFMGLLVTVLAQRALRPVRDLTEAVKGIGRGEYAQVSIPASAGDEVALLAREFNAMAERLRERDRQLGAQREQLLRSERLAAVGRVSAQITHEIRNPLSSIGLNSEELEEEISHLPASEARERLLGLLRAMMKEIDRLAEITEEYLRFARLPKPQMEPADVNEVLTDLFDFLDVEMSGAGVKVERDLGAGLPLVNGDEAQLRQALLNLARNAREALQPRGGGTLRASTRATVGEVTIELADDGPGIPPEVLPSIFDPFFSTKERGTGLGLALTQQIVQEHGGRIEVRSEPGKGAAFAVRLPASPARREAPARPASAAVSD
jgi:signal transduction histidine kinase